jgi:hypothetical protein
MKEWIKESKRKWIVGKERNEKKRKKEENLLLYSSTLKRIE